MRPYRYPESYLEEWDVEKLHTQTDGVLGVGFAGAGLIALLMMAVAFALHQARQLTGRAHLASWLVVGAISVLALGAANSLANQNVSQRTVPNDQMWQPFKLPAIANEIAKGRVVFVDVTADWCLTCKINKTLVLERSEVAGRLATSAVTAMKADWTMPDPRISAYLTGFGRYGIPFNAVYGPTVPEGIVLPELLTTGIVLEAISRASRSPTATTN